jgi:orotate phosphoribosyltransferase
VKEFELNLESLRENLLLSTFIYCYRRGSFILSSGRSSSYYIDGKQVLMTPQGLRDMATYILASLQDLGLEAETVGGLTLGADPIAAAVCALSASLPLYHPLDCFIVRKEAKKHGTASRIEGPFRKRARVILVDDVLTTGSSILSAAEAVRAAEGQIGAIFVLVDREEGGREALLGEGCRVEAVLCRTELEQLQQRMEESFPALFEALQAAKPRWSKAPWSELEIRLRSKPLADALTQAAKRLEQAGANGRLDEEGEKKAAQLLLAAIKAATLRPEGEAEALRIIERVKIDFAEEPDSL